MAQHLGSGATPVTHRDRNRPVTAAERVAEHIRAEQWRRWAAAEPTLAGLRYESLRAVLADRGGDPHIRDRLLGALVRIAQGGDQAAGAVLVACLAPGLRARARRYRGCLSWADAYSELACGLWRAITRYRTATHPNHVASRLLARSSDRLRRCADREHRHARRQVPLDGSGPMSEPGPELPAGALLASAVTTGVITRDDAALVAAVDLHDLPLADAARRARCSYEAAKKRRQRAHARLATYLTKTATTGEDHAQPMRCRQTHTI